MQVSFGRAIKVNTTPAIAKKIAQSANVANYSDFSVNPQRKKMEKFLDKIFNDTQYPNGQARVVEFAPDDVYIFSGKEAAEEAKLRNEAEAKIKANEDFVYWLPDRITRRQQQIRYENINQSILETTQTKIKRLVEDGQNGKRKSSLDIHTEEVKDDKKRKLIRRTGLTYKSSDSSGADVKKLDLTK